ncbi:acyl-CoA dehydrogenase family protein [Seohaeicola nanhaiensis]|uniref:Acyl-CoA dehydrogenase family protein n=1 Tax=Seohaeicola nanhaiensis TaxID=1387282 RepID=A0ABV9KLL7_9RHOB
MDLKLTADHQRFRMEVRAFLQEHLPEDLRQAARRQFHIAPEMMRRWQRILNAKGWAAPGWPVEAGGTGWSAIQRYIYDEEYCLADGPLPLQMGHGVQIIGPVLYTYGTAEQKARYLPRILRGEDFWAQGFSEPGAGSDLASLRTRAVRDGDDWVITGHKIWTSLAHHANMLFLLARTDPDVKPQKGISFFVFPIDTPGVIVRPIISIDRGHSLNETFFDEVRVPADSLIGEEGQGWSYAKFLLGHERFNIAEIARTKRRLQRLWQIAGDMPCGEGTLAQDQSFCDKITALEIELASLEQLGLRVAWEMDEGISNMQSASILKLRGTRLIQSVTELSVEAMGYAGLAFHPAQDGSQLSPPAPESAQGKMEEMLFLRAATIYGGSSETQLNILANLIYAEV